MPVLDAAMLEFLEWTAEYYHHPIGEVVSVALPLALRSGHPAEEVTERWQLTATGLESGLAQPGGRAPRQRALLERLSASGPVAATGSCRGKPTLARHLARAATQRLGRNRRGAGRSPWPCPLVGTPGSAAHGCPGAGRRPLSCVRASGSGRGCWMASPAAARPRCTCASWQRRWRAAPCWCCAGDRPDATACRALCGAFRGHRSRRCTRT